MNSTESRLELSVHLYHKASAMLIPRKDENLSRVRCVASEDGKLSLIFISETDASVSSNIHPTQPQKQSLRRHSNYKVLLKCSFSSFGGKGFFVPSITAMLSCSRVIRSTSFNIILSLDSLFLGEEVTRGLNHTGTSDIMNV